MLWQVKYFQSIGPLGLLLCEKVYSTQKSFEFYFDAVIKRKWLNTQWKENLAIKLMKWKSWIPVSVNWHWLLAYVNPNFILSCIHTVLDQIYIYICTRRENLGLPYAGCFFVALIHVMIYSTVFLFFFCHHKAVVRKSMTFIHFLRIRVLPPDPLYLSWRIKK